MDTSSSLTALGFAAARCRAVASRSQTAKRNRTSVNAKRCGANAWVIMGFSKILQLRTGDVEED